MDPRTDPVDPKGSTSMLFEDQQLILRRVDCLDYNLIHSSIIWMPDQEFQALHICLPWFSIWCYHGLIARTQILPFVTNPSSAQANQEGQPNHRKNMGCFIRSNPPTSIL